VHFFIGDPCSPVFTNFEVADDGGSYRTSAQYVSECIQSRLARSARRATIVSGPTMVGSNGAGGDGNTRVGGRAGVLAAFSEAAELGF
jgi:hypothetical protein